jgi:hypothetical protein
MEFIFELIAEFVGEVLFGTICKFTGALFVWLFYGMKLDFSYYLNKDDDDEISSGIGCLFYGIIFITWLILHNC